MTLQKIIKLLILMSFVSFSSINANEYDLSYFCNNDCSYERKQFKKYAKRGSNLAMLNYGLMLVTAKGGNKEVEKGVRLIKKASSNGGIAAQYQLGYMYAFGLHVEQDLEKAKLLLERASKKGVKKAKQYYKLVEKGAIRATQEVYSTHLKNFEYTGKRSKTKESSNRENAGIEIISISPGFNYEDVIQASIDQVCKADHCGPTRSITPMPVLKLSNETELLFVKKELLSEI